MQGQRSSVESFSETFEFDHRSNSINSGMDEQICWNTMLLNPAETQNLPNYRRSPSDGNMSYANMATEGSAGLTIWTSGGPSSGEASLNQGNPDDAKMEHIWSASLTTNVVGGPRIAERHFEAANMLSLENVNINLNSTQADDGQFPENSNKYDVPQNPEKNAACGGASSEAPCNPVTLESEHVPSSNAFGSTSVVGFMSEDGDSMPGSSLDGRRLACKRKNIEGVPGQFPVNGSASLFHQSESSLSHSVSASNNVNTNLNLTSPSNHLSAANSSSGLLNPRLGIISRGITSDCYPYASVAGNAESSHRNFRLRINPAHQHDIAPPNLYSSAPTTIGRSGVWSSNEPSSHPTVFNEPLEPRQVVASLSSQSQPRILESTVAGNAESSRRNFRLRRISPTNHYDLSLPNLCSQGDTMQHSSIWASDELSSHPVLFSQSLEPRPVFVGSSAQSQPTIPVIPGMPQHVHPFPLNGSPNSRIGSSSCSLNSEERLMGMQEETNSRSMPRSSISEQPVFVPPTEIRHMVQDSANWNLTNGGMSMGRNLASTSRASSSSGLNSSVGAAWLPHQNPPIHYSRNFPEVVRRSLFPSGGADSGGQSSNLPLQRNGHSASTHEIGHQSGSGLRGHQQAYMRAALLMDRHSDGVPLSIRSLAAREGRSRMISEIRNALDLMRRGENLRLEDVFILDQSLFFGGAADLHDRHREMRLDVDNMTYEELLALEERIGNVSTGLSEETVSKCLRQRMFSSMTVQLSVENEPCCICQEEYTEGEDLGTLDCGHDFHTACIKQWLLQKNLCPICKTTALVT